MPVDIQEEIANYVFAAKYARYIPEKNRRETWEEAVERVCNMHLKKFRHLKKEHRDDIKKAFDVVKRKLAVPSMRGLQFGGEAVMAHQSRQYNCAVRHVDSPRAFAEIMYLLLCGCGVGIGLHKPFLNRLPDLVSEDDKSGIVNTYVVQDSIEGWADSIEALLNCYFRNTPYTGRKIVFDYSRIRPKGSPLKTGGGKAPGHEPLKKAHAEIKSLLDYLIESENRTRLRPIDVYDILMHCADAVISGGIRRAATNTLFNRDDAEMMDAKTLVEAKDWVLLGEVEGTSPFSKEPIKKYEIHISHRNKTRKIIISEFEFNQLKNENKISWIHVEPQRARSNNSVLLPRKHTSFEEFAAIIEKSKMWGEPGFAFVEDERVLLNPSLRGGTRVQTSEGIFKIEELEGKSFYVKNLRGELAPATCRLSGRGKKLLKIKLKGGHEYFATEEHKWPVLATSKIGRYFKKETKDLVSGDRLPVLVSSKIFEGGAGDVDDGFLIGWLYGDGWISKRKDNGHIQYGFIVSHEDASYGIRDRLLDILRRKTGTTASWTERESGYEINIQREDAQKYFDQFGVAKKELGLPAAVWTGSEDFRKGFIDGLLSSDGSINASLKTQISALCLTSSREAFAREFAELLGFYGIKTSIHRNQFTGRSFPNGKIYDKTYTSYIVRISSRQSLTHFAKLFSLSHKKKNDKYNEYRTDQLFTTQDWVKIESIEETSIYEDVWDLSVDDDTHCFQLGHCITGNCFEISFIPVTEDGVCGVEFCNLSSVNGTQIKDMETFKQAIWAAAVIGTLQASYTDFPYLSPTAKHLTEEEALLGISITGILDSPEFMLNPDNLVIGSNYAKQVNEEWAAIIGINPAARVTCVKPEGTSTLVLKSFGSGANPVHAGPKYLRRVQANKIENVYGYFKEHNPHAVEESVWSANKSDDVISFPMEVPEGILTKEEITGVKHLEIIKNLQKHWVKPGCGDSNKKGIQHSVSCTVVVKDNEWDIVTKYLYKNRSFFTAVALLPEIGDKAYPQAPNERMVTEEELAHFDELIGNWKKVDYTKLVEVDDLTEVQNTVACAGGACEIV